MVGAAFIAAHAKLTRDPTVIVIHFVKRAGSLATPGMFLSLIQ